MGSFDQVLIMVSLVTIKKVIRIQLTFMSDHESILLSKSDQDLLWLTRIEGESRIVYGRNMNSLLIDPIWFV